MNRFLKYIDTASRVSGNVTSWFIILQMIVTVAIVIERYFFHRGDDWSFELSWMFYSMVFLFAFAYTLVEKGHVKVDPLFKLYPLRMRAIVDSISYLFLLAVCVALVCYGIPFTKTAWVIKECSWHTTVGAPVYYIKTMIPIAFGLLGLQGIAELMRTLSVAIKGKEL
ncbi:MAG: TRAP transporter small permease subunit [Deltaproteobacteria bacterium]|nr:TRAP transporter small permease subunit [Deltaproteobacteria bacterium]